MEKKKKHILNDAINAFSSWNCSIENLSKLKAKSCSVCYSVAFQTIKRNLLGAHTVFHYLTKTHVQFLTAEYEQGAPASLTTSNLPERLTKQFAGMRRASGREAARSTKCRCLVQMGQSMTRLLFLARGVSLLNYHLWLSPLLQVPSITHPSHICLLIGVAAGDQPVHLFIPPRLSKRKKSRLIRAPMEKQETENSF